MLRRWRAPIPSPWVVVETPAGYGVDDATGQAIAWFYGEDEPTRRNVMQGQTRAEARRFATFARLPALLVKDSKPAG